MIEKPLIFLASDHAGFLAKEKVLLFLKKSGYVVCDLGTNSSERVDYPHYAMKLVRKLNENKEGVGVLICGSGIGVSMVVNRYQGIRAALCRNEQEAKLAKQHNNANILCLDGRFTEDHKREAIITSWLSAEFEKGRHQERLALFNTLGEKIEGEDNE